MNLERFIAVGQVLLGIALIYWLTKLGFGLSHEFSGEIFALPVLVIVRGLDQLLRISHLSFRDPRSTPEPDDIFDVLEGATVQYLNPNSLLEKRPGLPGGDAFSVWGMMEVTASSKYEGRTYGYVNYGFKRGLAPQHGIYIRWEPYRQHYFSGYVSNTDDSAFGMMGLISVVVYYPLVSWLFGVGGTHAWTMSWFVVLLIISLLLGMMTQVIFEMFEKDWHLRERLSKILGRSDARLRAVQLHCDLAKILGVKQVYAVFVEGRMVTFYPLKQAREATAQMAEFDRIERTVDVLSDFGMMKFQERSAV